MAGYSEAQKSYAFEQWFGLGQVTMYLLHSTLNDLHKQGNLPMKRVPSIPTLSTWKKNYEWNKRAEERNALVKTSLHDDAIRFREDMYGSLKKLAQVKLKAQLDIIERAKLDELEPREARKLLEQAGLLSKDGINDFKNAMLIAGYDQEDENNPLSELFVSIEKALGPDTSGELKMALMARIDNKTKVIEGSTT